MAARLNRITLQKVLSRFNRVALGLWILLTPINGTYAAIKGSNLVNESPVSHVNEKKIAHNSINGFPHLPTTSTISAAQMGTVGKQKISLNFQKTPVRVVLKTLADFAGINMVVSKQVQGDVTLRLDDISWQEALTIILNINGLDKRVLGTNIFAIVARNEILAEEQEKSALVDAVEKNAALQSKIFILNYARATDIAALLKESGGNLLSQQGKFIVDSRTNSLWIKDSAMHLAEISKYLKSIDIPEKQILIAARIVNVTKDFARDLGLKFTASPVVYPDKQDLSADMPGVGHLNLDFGASPLAITAAPAGIVLARMADGVLLDLELSALESEGRGEIISSPRLLTSDRQEAIIESGEEIPYQETGKNGATATAFKKAVLSLRVTPRVTPDKRIMMALKINQDIPSVKVINGVPAILTKEIQTNVVVNNGQTIVLGGIYKRDRNNSINRVPFLGNLPLVGVLFRNKSTIVKNEELLIFITPRIIGNALSRAAMEAGHTRGY